MTKKERLKKEYKKQRDRVRAAERRLVKQGYELLFEMPKIPKKITEGSVRKLQKITPKEIRKGSTWTDITTGEKVEGERQAYIRRLKKEQKESPYQGGIPDDWDVQAGQPEIPQIEEPYEPQGIHETEVGLEVSEDELVNQRILEVFVDELYATNNRIAINLVMKWLEGLIHRMGKSYAASLIKEANDRGIQLEVTPYESDGVEEKVDDYLQRIVLLDPESGQFVADQLTDLQYEGYGWG